MLLEIVSVLCLETCAVDLGSVQVNVPNTPWLKVGALVQLEDNQLCIPICTPDEAPAFDPLTSPVPSTATLEVTPSNDQPVQGLW